MVVSHKVCWPSPDSRSGYATDGGFPVQMRAISELFSNTELLLPCSADGAAGGTPAGREQISESSRCPFRWGTGFRRKISMLRWIIKEGPVIWRSVRESDAVHAPIPGDVGTTIDVWSEHEKAAFCQTLRELVGSENTSRSVYGNGAWSICGRP